MFLQHSEILHWQNKLHKELKELKEQNQKFSNIKVIPLKVFYYQTFFETLRNQHS